jgi:hypothetical protein
MADARGRALCTVMLKRTPAPRVRHACAFQRDARSAAWPRQDDGAAPGVEGDDVHAIAAFGVTSRPP